MQRFSSVVLEERPNKLLDRTDGLNGEFGSVALGVEATMRNEFTAVFEQEDDWYIGYCPEISGANGQGRTIEECKASLADAISLILEDRREDERRERMT